MEYIYAALLLHNSGKEVTEDGITAVMDAAGIKADKGRIKALISALSDVNIDEAMAQAQPAYAPSGTASTSTDASSGSGSAKGREGRKGRGGEEEERGRGEGRRDWDGRTFFFVWLTTNLSLKKEALPKKLCFFRKCFCEAKSFL